MTPPPPSEPESPKLPPRHRSNKDSLSSDTSERGFWDLDENDEDSLPLPVPTKVEPRASTRQPDPLEGAPRIESEPAPGGTMLPSHSTLSRRSTGVERFKEAREAKARTEAATTVAGVGPEDSLAPQAAAVGAAPVDAMGPWDVPGKGYAAFVNEEVFEDFVEHPQSLEAERIELTLAATQRPEEPARPPVEDSIAAPVTRAALPAVPTDPDDEFVPVINPDAKPLSFRPHFRFTLVETIGLICLVLALVAGGVWAYRMTLKRIGHTDASHGKVQYPVKGSQVTITSVVSYWRAPHTTGDKPEIVRRGVALIPVVEVALSGGPGAVRILFNNKHGKKVGDTITRSVNGETTLITPATDGFDDISMLAAYRTDPDNPWLIEIAEAPSENSPGTQFKTLLTAPVSPEKR